MVRKAKKKSKEFDQGRFDRYVGYRESGMNEYDAKELSRYQNEEFPEKCGNCGAGPEHFEEGGGMVGETVVWCGVCHSMVWEDTIGAIRRVL